MDDCLLVEEYVLFRSKRQKVIAPFVKKFLYNTLPLGENHRSETQSPC